MSFNKFALVVFLGLLGSCSARVAEGTCKQSAECRGGEACFDGACRTLCSGDTQCEGSCCVAGVCGGSCENRATPEVTAVNGTGSADSNSSHATQHLVDRLAIAGMHLSGATAQLMVGATQIDLESCGQESTDTQLLAMLPTDIAPGTYTLTVSNAAGSCSSGVTLLQGEQGPAGSYTIGFGLSLGGSTLAVDMDDIREALGTSQTVFVGPSDFEGWGASPNWYRFASYATRSAAEESSSMEAHIPLPDGVTLTSVACRIDDKSAAEDMTVTLTRYHRASDMISLASSSCGSAMSTGTVGFDDFVITPNSLCNVVTNRDITQPDSSRFTIRIAMNADVAKTLKFIGCTAYYTGP